MPSWARVLVTAYFQGWPADTHPPSADVLVFQLARNLATATGHGQGSDFGVKQIEGAQILDLLFISCITSPPGEMGLVTLIR